MRKYILLIVSIAFSVCSYGQTKLSYERHAFVIGDNHDFYLAKSADEGKSGANITWDFSALVPSGSLTSHMIDPSTTLKGSSVSEANLALVEDANIFYFKVTTDGMEQFGTATGNTLSTFTEPFLKIKYPFAFGDAVSGDYSSKMESATAPCNCGGSFTVEGDAWGTLILPNGVYKNTLRIKQTRTFNKADSSNKEITYRWYCSTVRYPLLVIIKYENQGKSSVAKVAYYAHSPNENLMAGTNPNALLNAGKGIEIYPNPITSLLTVSYEVPATSNVFIDLYDASGAVVSKFLAPVTREPGKYSEDFNISSNLPSGNYFVKATIDGQSFVKKVVKVKNN
jgi:hypothetical protein